jgi:hypothetical protein
LAFLRRVGHRVIRGGEQAVQELPEMAIEPNRTPDEVD